MTRFQKLFLFFLFNTLALLVYWTGVCFYAWRIGYGIKEDFYRDLEKRQPEATAELKTLLETFVDPERATVVCPASLPKDVCHSVKMVQDTEGRKEFMEWMNDRWDEKQDRLLIMAQLQSYTPDGIAGLPATLLALHQACLKHPLSKGDSTRQDLDTRKRATEFLEYAAFGDQSPPAMRLKLSQQSRSFMSWTLLIVCLGAGITIMKLGSCWGEPGESQKTGAESEVRGIWLTCFYAFCFIGLASFPMVWALGFNGGPMRMLHTRSLSSIAQDAAIIKEVLKPRFLSRRLVLPPPSPPESLPSGQETKPKKSSCPKKT